MPLRGDGGGGIIQAVGTDADVGIGMNVGADVGAFVVVIVGVYVGAFEGVNV